jgi:hypothetical protein
VGNRYLVLDTPEKIAAVKELFHRYANECYLKDHHPAIVDRDTFARVAKRLAERGGDTSIRSPLLGAGGLVFSGRLV